MRFAVSDYHVACLQNHTDEWEGLEYESGELSCMSLLKHLPAGQKYFCSRAIVFAVPRHLGACMLLPLDGIVAVLTVLSHGVFLPSFLQVYEP